MTDLTVIQGGHRRTFKEHPMETARRALLDAAELEGDEWAALCHRLASSLPDRAPTPLSPREERWARQREEEHAARDTWTRLPVAARGGLVLEVLGDDRLIIPELVERMNAELGYPPEKVDKDGLRKGPHAVHGGHVRYLVTRMYRAGQLERAAEPAPGCKIRHRYFRKQAVHSPGAVA